MSGMRVVFMGTPQFAVPCLNILVEEGYNIAAVVTQPDRPKGRGQKVVYSPVKEFALKHQLPILQPVKVKDRDFIDKIAELKPDAIIVVAFGQLLSEELLNLPQYGCVNVHASLLPVYRGAAPIHWAVINGEQVTGVTTMYMDIGMDTGDMIIKSEISIEENETTGSVHDRLQILGAEVLKQTLQQIAEHRAPRTPQDNQLATYAPLLKRALEKIDWGKSALQIHNLIRGLSPWPVAYCSFQNKTFKVWQSRVYDANWNNSDCVPGRIRLHSAQGIVVETGQGLIEILEVQPESKRRMSALECACGYCLDVGAILE